MALDTTKWQVQTDKSIRYIGGDHGTATENQVTVLEMHRFLQDLGDNASVANDDYMSITFLNPSDKQFDTIITLTNGYTLDDAHTTKASEFIYAGTIIQGAGGTEKIYDGIKVISSRGTIVNVIQDNAVLADKYWNTVPDGDTFAGINPDPANGVCMQFMILVADAGAAIDNGTLIFNTREWGKTYSEFRIPSTSRGENTVPLTFFPDLNNTTTDTTIDGWSTIANITEGWNQIDVNQDATDENYYSEWNRDIYDINQFYERMKRISENGSTTQIYGMDGELFRGITHSITNQAPGSPGAFVEAGATPVSWGTGATAGTGQILANDTTSDILYIQLLTGVVPTDSMLLTQGANTATTAAASAVVEKTVSVPFCGASTGSSLVGAYGFSLEYADLAVSDKITSLDGIALSPPNNVSFTVLGILSGWRIMVAPESGGLIDTTQMTLNGALTGVTTSVVVNEVIPDNTPTSGTIRILMDDGRTTRHPYSAVDGPSKTFTITSFDFTGDEAATTNGLYISYIDDDSAGTSISFNTVQTSTQTLFVEARNAGTGPDYTDSIKPAITSGTLNATGGSATISAVSDA